jgi:polar amino acid transport system substrate-binding protein
MTTHPWLQSLSTVLVLVAFSGILFAQELPYPFPQFRFLDPTAKAPQQQVTEPVRIAIDQSFPPFSFMTKTGTGSGASVDLVLGACKEARLQCEVSLKSPEQLLPALSRGEADVVVSGFRVTPAIAEQALVTRPYFKSPARFAVLTGSPIESTSVRGLAGRRVGMVKDSLHAAWLQRHYASASLIPFPDEISMLNALRAKELDAVFGDSLHLIFWVSGSASAGCCRLLGNGFADRTSFTRNFTFLVRPGRDDIRQALDWGLDQLQRKGETGRIFTRYMPLNPW